MLVCGDRKTYPGHLVAGPRGVGRAVTQGTAHGEVAGAPTIHAAHATRTTVAVVTAMGQRVGATGVNNVSAMDRHTCRCVKMA